MRSIGRKGDWTQLFMVFFFVLILVMSVALLALDQGRLESNRETLGVDLSDQEANVQLINLLRHPAAGGFAGDGSKASIASIISINNGAYDAMILESVKRALPEQYYAELIITYPDRTYTVSNTEFHHVFKESMRTHGPAYTQSEAAKLNLPPEQLSGYAPQMLASTQLPINIKVELLLSRKIGDEVEWRSE